MQTTTTMKCPTTHGTVKTQSLSGTLHRPPFLIPINNFRLWLNKAAAAMFASVMRAMALTTHHLRVRMRVKLSSPALRSVAGAASLGITVYRTDGDVGLIRLKSACQT